MPTAMQDLRDGEEHVRCPRQHRVDPAAEETGGQPDDEPDEEREPGGDHADEERDARAVHRAHEQIAAFRVGSEPEVAVRPERDAVVVGRVRDDLVRRMAGDRRCDRAAEDRNERQEHDHDRAGQRRLVLAQARPEKLERRLPRDGDGLMQRNGAPSGHLEFGWIRHPRRNAITPAVGPAAILTIVDRPGLRPDGPLNGRLVRIEPIEERHREGLREAADRDPAIHRFTNMYSLGFDRWFDLALASEVEIPFVVHVGDRAVGSTRYLNVEPFHRRAEIGWTWLERGQWGTGANVETKYLLLRNAFDGAGLMRVEFKTDARNLRVRGALLGIGCRFEGIFHKHMVLPDSIRDSAWYAIVDDDWPRVRSMLEAKIERHTAA